MTRRSACKSVTSKAISSFSRSSTSATSGAAARKQVWQSHDCPLRVKSFTYEQVLLMGKVILSERGYYRREYSSPPSRKTASLHRRGESRTGRQGAVDRKYRPGGA